MYTYEILQTAYFSGIFSGNTEYESPVVLAAYKRKTTVSYEP